VGYEIVQVVRIQRVLGLIAADEPRAADLAKWNEVRLRGNVEVEELELFQQGYCKFVIRRDQRRKFCFWSVAHATGARRRLEHYHFGVDRARQFRRAAGCVVRKGGKR
jgi:hypothetical protein